MTSAVPVSVIVSPAAAVTFQALLPLTIRLAFEVVSSTVLPAPSVSVSAVPLCVTASLVVPVIVLALPIASTVAVAPAVMSLSLPLAVVTLLPASRLMSALVELTMSPLQLMPSVHAVPVFVIVVSLLPNAPTVAFEPVVIKPALPMSTKRYCVLNPLALRVELSPPTRTVGVEPLAVAAPFTASSTPGVPDIV